MKLLVIDEEFPYPLNTGKRIRTFSLTRALAQSNDVSYLAYGDEDSESARHLESVGIHCHAVPPPDRSQHGYKFYLRLLANLWSPYPYIVTSHYTGRFETRLAELVDENGYDVVICEWTPYALYLQAMTDTKSIIVAHNIEANIWRRYAETEKNALKRLYIKFQYHKVLSFERECFRWAQGATAVSSIEAKEIESCGLPYEVETVENGVDVDYFKPQDAAVDPNQLVFTGSMDWRPNQDAADFFVRSVLPRLQQKRPDIHVVIVGRKPPSHIVELGKMKGVTVTGTVDDVRPYIAKSAAYVVPLRVGGGSRLKILEAMAMKKAVVSTTVGAEGLEVADGENILLADSAASFAETVLRCLEQPDLQAKLTNNGYNLVHSRYRWDILGEKLNRYLARVADGN